MDREESTMQKQFTKENWGQNGQSIPLQRRFPVDSYCWKRGYFNEIVWMGFCCKRSVPRTTDDGQTTNRLRLWYMTSSTQCLTNFFLPFELRNGPEVRGKGYYDVTFNSELRTRSVWKVSISDFWAFWPLFGSGFIPVAPCENHPQWWICTATSSR
jgi:hypothetical protein